MTGEWKEARDRIIDLPTHDPEVFGIYIHWIYSRQIAIPVSSSDSTTLCQFLDSYILGDMLLDGDFRDAVLDALAQWKLALSRSWLSYIYENTKEKDPLRLFSIDTLVYIARRIG